MDQLQIMQDKMSLLLLISRFRVIDFFGDRFKFAAASALQCPVEARLVSDVALALVNGHFQDQAVLVAVNENPIHFLHMPAFFAFPPQFLP